MAYFFDTSEELDEQLVEQMRKFRQRARGSLNLWYRINAAAQRAYDATAYHENIEDFILPNVFEETRDAVSWYHRRDPQKHQVTMVKKSLAVSSRHKHKRGRVTPLRLKMLMLNILKMRIMQYENPPSENEKPKIMCIVGGSGVGKTLASLHLQNFKGANVICSFTTRPPRPTEVEGREHHFIDIVPDRSELIAYTHFGGYYYYAAKWQVFGPCTVYVIDEKGLDNLRTDCGDQYQIFSVFINRTPRLRKKVGVSVSRIRRDEYRDMKGRTYDYVVENNGTKKQFFQQIERIYEEIKNK